MKCLECEHVFYSIIGNHAGETPNNIINRKKEEIDRCGYSLWSAKIDKKSVEQVWKLTPDNNVIVLCKTNDRARDPVKASNVPYFAQYMLGPNNKSQVIPNGIKASFTKGKNYQAYVVSKYTILEDEEMFDFSNYNTILADNTEKPFAERFKCRQFQNTYGKKLKRKKIGSCTKQIKVIMTLKYPFVVNLK